jgi:hypothetical protein
MVGEDDVREWLRDREMGNWGITCNLLVGRAVCNEMHYRETYL